MYRRNQYVYITINWSYIYRLRHLKIFWQKHKTSRHNQLVSRSLNVREIMDFFRNYFGKTIYSVTFGNAIILASANQSFFLEKVFWVSFKSDKSHQVNFTFRGILAPHVLLCKLTHCRQVEKTIIAYFISCLLITFLGKKWLLFLSHSFNNCNNYINYGINNCIIAVTTQKLFWL